MHYKDGTPAQLGDIARGKPYNTPYEVTGVVTRITPGSDSCNLIVHFAKVDDTCTPFEDSHSKTKVLGMGPWPMLGHDYGRVGDFTLVHRNEVK